MKQVLVVGDGQGVGQLLREMAGAGYQLEWARDEGDVIELIKDGKQFDSAVLYQGEGLANADDLALELKTMMVNISAVLVVQAGVHDDGVTAGIALGNIDRVIPECSLSMVEQAFREIEESTRQ